MLRRFSIDFALFSIALDAALIFAALAISTNLRPSMSQLSFIKFIPYPLHTPTALFFAFPLFWVLILLSTSVYDGRKNLRIWRELASLSTGSALAVIALAGVLYLSYREVSRALFLVFAGLAFILLISWRLAFRLGFRSGFLKSVQSRNILIVGNNPLGRELEKLVLAYKTLGLQVVGYIDEDTAEQPLENRVLDSCANIRQVVEKLRVDDVVIVLPTSANDLIYRLVTDLSRLPVKVWIIPDYFNLAMYKAHIEEFAGLPILDLRPPGLSDRQRLAKRTFDLAICLFFLPLTLLLMGMIAVVIRLDSRGPLFFRQARAGENGRLFEIIKFRTMVIGAEALRSRLEPDDARRRSIQKTPDDPRVTKAGKWLRKTSLDELPQVFNILKGEMSLVGPRPEQPYLVDKYQDWQHKRFCVPPGVTGWWQVTGRSEKPMHLHTEDDLYYIENYSIFLDLLILVKTIGVVIWGKGAY